MHFDTIHYMDKRLTAAYYAWLDDPTNQSLMDRYIHVRRQAGLSTEILDFQLANFVLEMWPEGRLTNEAALDFLTEFYELEGYGRMYTLPRGSVSREVMDSTDFVMPKSIPDAMYQKHVKHGGYTYQERHDEIRLLPPGFNGSTDILRETQMFWYMSEHEYSFYDEEFYVKYDGSRFVILRGPDHQTGRGKTFYAFGPGNETLIQEVGKLPDLATRLHEAAVRTLQRP